MSHPQLFRHLPRILDVYQFTLADSRTALPGFVPRPVRGQQLGPIREGCALHRLHFVNRAASILEKRTVRMTRDAESPQVLRAKDMLLFEIRLREAEISGNAGNIAFCQIHEALFFAALRAAGLALETNVQFVLW